MYVHYLKFRLLNNFCHSVNKGISIIDDGFMVGQLNVKSLQSKFYPIFKGNANCYIILVHSSKLIIQV